MYPGFGTRLERELEKLYEERILKGQADKSAKNVICIKATSRQKSMIF